MDNVLERADSITTEVIRHALASGAKQMKTVLVRTAVSPIVYEGQDFACALYDRQMRLLAQAETIPIFVGTMGFCIQAAVDALGGEAMLEPDDVLLYNVPYFSGSHAQDAAIIEPVFLDGRVLIGYAITKAHWGDIGGKSPYPTDSTDVYQEGTCFPGVKLYRAGRLVDDILRIIIANSRMSEAIKGDIHAQVVSVKAGANELKRICARYGFTVFELCVERMLEHGEAIVRAFLSALPNGRYSGKAHLDNDGLSDVAIEFEVALEISGTDVIFDFTQAPDALAGPLNCPLPMTICAARVAIAMLAGNGEMPNEGTFRPIRVETRRGSMFDPQSPAPCFMYAWPAFQAIEAVNEALAKVFDQLVPSGSAADVCGIVAFGYDPASAAPFFAGVALPCGQGAHASGDGATLFIPGLSQSTLPSTELMEMKFPVLFDRVEFIADTGGAGRFRGGLALAYHWTPLVDVELFCTIERTKVPSWAQQGGLSGLANSFVIEYADGARTEMRKGSGKKVSAGARFCVTCGGGGGYGPPSERSIEAVRRDLAEGYITAAHARQHYPHAMSGESNDHRQ
ncbi:MAG: hydantoinase B/oxoprolinase family protein [Gammaproteobacteria bacterium]